VDHPRPITACRPTRQAGRIAHEPATRTQRPRRDFRGSHAEDHPHRLFNAPCTPLNPIPSNSPTLAAIRTLAAASPRSAAQRTCAAVASPLRRTPASTSRRRSSARRPRATPSPQSPISASLRTGFPVEELHRAAHTPPRFPPCATSHQLLRPASVSQEGNKCTAHFPTPFYLLLRLAGPADEPAPPAPSRAPTKPQILRPEPTGGLPMPQR